MGLGNMIQALGGYPDAQPMAKALGKKVVEVENSGTPIVLKFEDGSKLKIDLEGDCCSSSYFSPEGLSDSKELEGATIDAIEEVESGNHGPYDDGGDYDCVSWHFLKIKTDKGDVTLDWRNDSNGYYDGWIVAGFEEAK